MAKITDDVTKIPKHCVVYVTMKCHQCAQNHRVREFQSNKFSLLRQMTPSTIVQGIKRRRAK